METPSISLRRHPRIALMLLAVGFIAVAIGIFFGEFWVVFMGVLPVIFAALMMLNPMVVITDQEVELRNVFGLVQASFAHDGFHLLHVQQDVLFIQRGDMHAPIRPVARGRLHAGDWEVMLKTIAVAKDRKGFSKNPSAKAQ